MEQARQVVAGVLKATGTTLAGEIPDRDIFRDKTKLAADCARAVEEVDRDIGGVRLAVQWATDAGLRGELDSLTTVLSQLEARKQRILEPPAPLFPRFDIPGAAR